MHTSKIQWRDRHRVIYTAVPKPVLCVQGMSWLKARLKSHRENKSFNSMFTIQGRIRQEGHSQGQGHSQHYGFADCSPGCQVTLKYHCFRQVFILPVLFADKHCILLPFLGLYYSFIFTSTDPFTHYLVRGCLQEFQCPCLASQAFL